MLKKYHEVGEIKEGNKIVGHIIKDGCGTLALKESPYLITTLKQFNDMVKKGNMQFYEWDSSQDRAIVQYSMDEINIMNQANFPAYRGTQYHKYNSHYKRRYIDAILSLGYVHVRVAGITDMLGCQISMVFFGKKENVLQWYQVVSSRLQGSVSASTIRFGGNNFSVSIPEYDILNNNIIPANPQGLIIDTGDVYTAMEMLSQHSSTRRFLAPDTKVQSIVSHLNTIGKNIIGTIDVAEQMGMKSYFTL